MKIKLDFDTAENGPSKIWILSNLPPTHPLHTRPAGKVNSRDLLLRDAVLVVPLVLDQLRLPLLLQACLSRFPELH